MKKRNASVDLLRYILMLFVIIIHVMEHGLGIGNMQAESYEVTQYTPMMILLLGFSVVAVDCFFMISGYFHSKFKIRKLIEYVVMGTFYATFMYMVSRFILGQPILIKSVLQRLLRGYNAYWFLNVWLVLFIFADYINALFNTLDDEQLKKFVAIYTVLNFYFGFLLDMNFYGSAFSVIPMFYCYTLGYAIKRFEEKIRKHKYYYGAFYIVASSLSVLISLVLLKTGHQALAHRVIMDYRAPLIVFAAACLFMSFLIELRIENKRLTNAVIKWGGKYSRYTL